MLILLTFPTNSSYSVFLTTLFLTTLLSLLKLTGVSSNLPISNLSTLFFKLLKPLDTFLNLSISNLSTSDIKLSIFLVKSSVSASAFVA